MAAPINDNFVDRIVLTGSNITVEGNNEGANMEPNEDAGNIGREFRASVWYSWTAPSPGVVYLSGGSTNPLFFLHVGVYRLGSGGGFLLIQPRWDAGYAVTSGQTLLLRVTTIYDGVVGIGGATGPFSVQLAFNAAPTNDHFANRMSVSSSPVELQAENIGASTETGEPGGVGASVWYSFTAPTQCVLYCSATTTNPTFNVNLSAYRGTVLSSLTAPSNPTLDGGWALTPGETIQLRVASELSGGVGHFTLSVRVRSREPVSGNDLFADRFDIAAPSYHFEGSLYGATNEAGEPLRTAERNRTLWWRFVAPEDGLLRPTLAVPYPADLMVYEGTNLGALTPLVPSGGNSYRMLAQREYAVQAATTALPSGGFTLDAKFLSTSNDFFAGRVRVSGTNWDYSGILSFATREPNEPQPSWPNTMWVSWTAPATGRVWIFQYDYGNDYRVYTGAALDALQQVSLVGIVGGRQCFLAVAGQEYHFQFYGGSEIYNMSVLEEPFTTPANDDFLKAEVVGGENIEGQPRTFVGATMEPGEPLHWVTGQSQKSLWWRWQAPRRGQLTMSFYRSLKTNDIVIGVYQGSSVTTLTKIGMGTNNALKVPVLPGETYNIAVAFPAEAMGDVWPVWQLAPPQTPYSPPPGNLLANPSFEGSTNGLDWNLSGGFGGHHFESWGADGVHWPVVPQGGRLWQDIVTIPGHEYRIRFAYRPDAGPGAVRFLWDDQLVGTATCQGGEAYWVWADFYARASNAVTRVTWTNIQSTLEMDAFSVLDIVAPPQITREPRSLSTLVGGNVVFTVESLGTRPLFYQWRFNGVALTNATDSILPVLGVTALAAGDYSVVITNVIGAVTSAPARLWVEAPTNATILVQPYGDIVPVGGYYAFDVVAVGTPPLRYQWFRDGALFDGATNRMLVFTNAGNANAGVYEVLVENDLSAVISLPASLMVTNASNGGGQFIVNNRLLPTLDAPVYDIDGMTRLGGGGAFFAQLYAGNTVDSLRAAHLPVGFRTSGPGYFTNSFVSLPYASPGQNVFAQVRVWESAFGGTYEASRAQGGKFGKSQILQVQAGFPPPGLPTPLTGLQSFQLQAGLQGFSVGQIELADNQTNGVVLWKLFGEAGFRYVVERSITPQDMVWRPLTVLTNVTGVITFSDPSIPGADAVLYRSRILD